MGTYLDAAQVDTSQLWHLLHVKAHACTGVLFFSSDHREKKQFRLSLLFMKEAENKET